MRKFSIILPVRNGGTYVKECVGSILAQTCMDFNLIVLDNNSTDGTQEWINALDDDRIEFYGSDTDLSIEQNWARVKDMPKNEFITLIGHDDILLPHYLEEMIRLIALHPEASLYQTHFNYIDSRGQFVRPCLPMDEKQFGYEFLACQMARTIDSMGTGYMMRSSDYDRLGGMSPAYPNLIFADYELWVLLGMIRYKATSKMLCFNYRVHKSVSALTNGDVYQQAFKRYIYFLIDLKEKNKDVQSVIDKYAVEFLMYFCESLSHRILKTPIQSRTIKVDAFIRSCEIYADTLISDQQFQPLLKKRILLAKKFDANPVTRKLFRLSKWLLDLTKG